MFCHSIPMGSTMFPSYSIQCVKVIVKMSKESVQCCFREFDKRLNYRLLCVHWDFQLFSSIPSFKQAKSKNWFLFGLLFFYNPTPFLREYSAIVDSTTKQVFSEHTSDFSFFLLVRKPHGMYIL